MPRAKKKPAPLTDAAYVAADGCTCPNCRSNEVQAGDSGFELSLAWRNVICRDCGAEWTDEYNLVGYGELDLSNVDKK